MLSLGFVSYIWSMIMINFPTSCGCGGDNFQHIPACKYDICKGPFVIFTCGSHV